MVPPGLGGIIYQKRLPRPPRTAAGDVRDSTKRGCRVKRIAREPGIVLSKKPGEIKSWRRLTAGVSENPSAALVNALVNASSSVTEVSD
jgi:hypothetical protein